MKASIGLAALLIGCASSGYPIRQCECRYEPSATQTVAASKDTGSKQALIGELPVAIVISKPSYSLHLFVWHHEWVRVSSYDVALGLSSGRKGLQGDNRTPEGAYTIEGKLSTIHDLYHSSYLEQLNRLTHNGQGYIGRDAFGPFALTLDYPNPEDRRMGRTGHGIMIHSVSDDKIGRPATHGCIGLRRSDMESLYRQVSVGTKVYIRSE